MLHESFRLNAIPIDFRDGFELLAHVLSEIAADNLLSVSAFGAWLVDDPLYAREPAGSVLVLRSLDLSLLDRLARHGARLGQLKLQAPLIMTPEYVHASCDTFPLELLEIQQLHEPLLGEDHFAACRFEPRDLRLQCERELKRELIQLRQGLLAAAGKRRALDEVCRASARRTMRILRGLLRLGGQAKAPERSAALVTAARKSSGVRLDELHEVVTGAEHIGFEGFERFYREIESLAACADRLPTGTRSGSEES